MDMRVKILHEILKAAIKRVVSRAGAFRKHIAASSESHLLQYLTGVVVFGHHHRDWIGNCSERWSRRRTAVPHRRFEPLYVGEKDLLLFEHVRSQLFRHGVEHLLDGPQLRMIPVMAVSHFFEQPLQPECLPSHEAVVCFDDVTGHSPECGFAPVVRILGTGNTVSGG